MAFIKFRPLTPAMNFKEIIDVKTIDKELLDLIQKEEEIVCAFKAVRDVGILTNKRIILEDKKGARGFRRKIYSIMYSSVSDYSLDIENMNAIIEMSLDSGYKVILSFYKPIPLDDMFKIYNYISRKILDKT